MHILLELLCPENGLKVTNATYNITTDASRISVIYQCNFGFWHSDGNLTRTCQSNNTWSGKAPVCTGQYYKTKEKLFYKICLYGILNVQEKLFSS